MGQKVHPTGIRLGITKQHSSVWYAESKDYADRLVGDIKIREYIEDKLNEYPNTISITPIFCDVCDRFLEYKAEIDVNQTLGYRRKNG